jgi:hypothetical protein
MVDVAKLAADHPELTAPAKQFEFAKDVQTSSAGAAGVPVTKFEVRFPQASALWTPTDDDSKWLRTQDGAPLLDKADGQQVAAVNIVVLQVGIDRSYLDRKYGNVPKTIMVDSGKAWVFSGGKFVEVKWSKASATSPIVLADGAGAPVQLAPGNTWVELMPFTPEGSLTIKKAPVASPSPSASAE